MHALTHWVWAGVAGLLAMLGQPVEKPAGAAPGPAKVEASAGLRVGVLTFNLRYSAAKDGDNAWPKRRDQVFEIIKDPRMDFVGVQEGLRDQLDDIHKACGEFGEIGVGREDGKTKGEYSAILYRTDKWKVLKSGTFWLSETPEVAGSMSWKTACTRVCTWAMMERAPDRAIEGTTLAKRQGGGAALWVFNTHMDHVSAEARSKGARLIAKRIAERGDEEPIVLTGDFNSGEDEEAARFFTAPPQEGEGKSPIGPLADTFRVLHPDEKDVATFHEFKPTHTTGKKIDYVLVKPGTKVIEAWIERRYQKGPPVVSPSDHFPVGAIVEFAPSAAGDVFNEPGTK